MHAHLRTFATLALLAFPAVVSAQDQPRARGHALGPDIAALARPVAAPRGGHPLGPDVAALRRPIGCVGAPAADGPCAISTVALDD